jgi:hypothetical protein
VKRVLLITIILPSIIISGFLFWPKPKVENSYQEASFLFLGYTNAPLPTTPDNAPLAPVRQAILCVTNTTNAELTFSPEFEYKTALGWYRTNENNIKLESYIIGDTNLKPTDAAIIMIPTVSNLTWRMKVYFLEKSIEDRKTDIISFITDIFKRNRIHTVRFSGNPYQLESQEFSE